MENTQTEFTRKFLIKEIPVNLDQYAVTEIVQGYIDVGVGKERRVKKSNNQYTKARIIQEGMEVIKIEESITEAEFKEAMFGIEENLIKKRRYFIPLDSDSMVAEVEIHDGKTEGLCIGKIRFENKKEALNFKPPSWFDKEITDILGLRSKYLAVMPRKLISTVIDRYSTIDSEPITNKVKQYKN